MSSQKSHGFLSATDDDPLASSPMSSNCNQSTDYCNEQAEMSSDFMCCIASRSFSPFQDGIADAHTSLK